MEFSLDGILSRAKPAACAARPVDFVAREITRRHTYFAVRSGRSPAVTAPLSKYDRYPVQHGEPPLTLSLFMITCQGTTQAR